jgi:hypothetical protein
MTRLQLVRRASWFLVFLLTACGGESESGDVRSRTNDNAGDAGAEESAADSTEGNDQGGNTTDADETLAGSVTDAADETTGAEASSAEPTEVGETDETSGAGLIDLPPPPDAAELEPAQPLLPDTPPTTPVSDLTEDEFASLCDPFLGEAQTTFSGLENLCGLAGLTAADEANAATVEEYRQACGQARLQCEQDSAAVQVVSASLECTVPENCTATVEEVDSCYQQLYLVNAALIEPLGGVEIPSCEELTPAQGGLILAQIGLYFLLTSAQAEEATGQPIDQEGDPCDELNMKCPGLAAPVGLELP